MTTDHPAKRGGNGRDRFAAALLEQYEGTGHEAADELRRAIRMDERQ
ncbi:hypothetical protein [Streptomyces sp. NPDC090298]